MKKFIKLITLNSLFLTSCSGLEYTKTVNYLDIERFMGKWYVLAARATYLEKGAHNSIEIYKWNEQKQRIDIDFKFNADSFEGKVKKIPQKGWIINKKTNATWEVSPFWPLYFDYLVLDLDSNYEWTIIGVPNQKYVWIMARDWQVSEEKINQLIERVEKLGYSTDDIKIIPHNGAL